MFFLFFFFEIGYSLLEMCRNRYKKVAASDPSLDVQEWLLHFHLNKFIELPAFEEYYLEEEYYEPLGKKGVSTDKTKRPSESFFQMSLFGSSSEDESSGTSASSRYEVGFRLRHALSSLFLHVKYTLSVS